MFYLKNLLNFKFKKARGIFLYDLHQHKIKYFSNFESLFSYSNKKIKHHFKNYLSKGWAVPFFHRNKEKENILKIFFYNKSLFKYFGSLKIYENKKLLNNVFNSSLKQSLHQIHFFQGKTDYIPFLISNFLISNNLKKHNINKNFDKIINLNSSKIIIKKFYLNFINFKKINPVKNSIIHIEGFPYWIESFELEKLKNFLINSDNLIHFYNFFINLINQYFYFSINFSLKLFEANPDTEKIKFIIKKYLNSKYYNYKKFLINNGINQFYLQPFFLDYLIVQFLYNKILKLLKKHNNFIILDDSKTGFRFFPFSIYLNFNSIFKNIEKGDSIFEKNNFFDMYIFGNNLSSGLDFNIIIFSNTFSSNFSSYSNGYNLSIFNEDTYNPFSMDILKYTSLYIKQTLIFKEFYKVLENFEYNFSFLNKKEYEHFFYLIGPYIKIYENLNNNYIKKIKKSKINKLVPFKSNNIKTIYLNIFKIFSQNCYGILPLDIKQKDMILIKELFKKYLNFISNK